MMNKKACTILLAVVVLFSTILLSGCTGERRIYKESYDIYKEAYDFAWQHCFVEARALFAQLPADYAPESGGVDAGTWIESIDKYADSQFVGKWERDTHGIEITLKVDRYKGVYLEYDKEYTSPGGVRIWSYGDVGVRGDGSVAYFFNSNQSNAENYELKLINSNTLEVWFDGGTGYTKEVSLRRE